MSRHNPYTNIQSVNITKAVDVNKHYAVGKLVIAIVERKHDSIEYWREYAVEQGVTDAQIKRIGAMLIG